MNIVEPISFTTDLSDCNELIYDTSTVGALPAASMYNLVIDRSDNNHRAIATIPYDRIAIGSFPMPKINEVILNDPAVIVMWQDGTKTVSKAMEGEEFKPEIGLAMAISRKYYESIGSKYPRGAFKQALKKARNYSKKSSSEK